MIICLKKIAVPFAGTAIFCNDDLTSNDNKIALRQQHLVNNVDHSISGHDIGANNI